MSISEKSRYVHENENSIETVKQQPLERKKKFEIHGRIMYYML